MDFLVCKICQTQFDEEKHQPRHAPCGHGLCSSCLRALIKDSIFECPKCRQKNKVFAPEDLPLNYDLIEVVRSFKEMKAPLTKVTPSPVSGASNDEVCKVHHKPIGHRCLSCQMWICDSCLDSHSEFIGCSTITSSKAMESIREKHTNNVDILLSVYEDDTNFLLSKIKDHNDKIHELNEKKKEIEEKVMQHSEEINKLQNALEEGTKQKENLIKSKVHIDAVKTPFAMTDGVEVLTQMTQSLRSWSVKNLGTDTPLGLLRLFKEKKKVYIEIVIRNEKMHSKLLNHDGNIHFHYFCTQSIVENSICMPFERLQKMIISSASLMFFELSIAGVVKGRVFLRLNKQLPNIREYLVKIAIGQTGKSLCSGKFDHWCDTCNGADNFGLSDIPVTMDSNVPSKIIAVVGDVIGKFEKGHLKQLFFQELPITRKLTDNERICAHVEEGMDMLLDLHKTKDKSALITDSGIVLERDQ